MSSTITVPYNGPLGKAPKLDASFTLKLEAGKQQKATAKEVEVGYITAYIIDKDLAQPGVRGAGGRLWVRELLRNAQDPSERAMIFRALYTRVGARRAGLTQFAEQLKGSKICVVDTLLIKRAYRSGNGIGALAIQSFHTLLPLLGGGRAFSGTVLLSPGMPLVTQKDYPGVELDVSEAKLARFYGESGRYVVYRAPKSEKEKGEFRTVMGRTV
ncbi:hypothetical protein LTR85_002144 [Meristemomyces frigidus]|nr:hypothetical protein LTR85_002144 [Meristemomyces frigidus]